MFIEVPARGELRQGDVLSGILFPRMRFEEVRLIASLDHDQVDSTVCKADEAEDNGVQWFTGQVKLMRGFAMVLSHCCDLELTHGSPRSLAVVVGPLFPVPTKISRKQEALERFRRNESSSYINMFAVNHTPPLPAELVVDLTRVVAIPTKPEAQYGQLLKKKVLQLTDEARLQLKAKLLVNYSRLTDEEKAAGLTLPIADAPAEAEATR